MTEPTKSDFYEYLNNNDSIDLELIINFDVVIDQSIVNWEYREFKNTIFKEKVIIKNVQINSGFLFANCKFEKGIVFRNVESGVEDIAFNWSIAFKKCYSKSIVFEKDCNLARRILITEECDIEIVSISETVIINGGFNIYESIISYLHIISGKNGQIDHKFSA